MLFRKSLADFQVKVKNSSVMCETLLYREKAVFPPQDHSFFHHGIGSEAFLTLSVWNTWFPVSRSVRKLGLVRFRDGELLACSDQGGEPVSQQSGFFRLEFLGFSLFVNQRIGC